MTQKIELTLEELKSIKFLISHMYHFLFVDPDHYPDIKNLDSEYQHVKDTSIKLQRKINAKLKKATS